MGVCCPSEHQFRLPINAPKISKSDIMEGDFIIFENIRSHYAFVKVIGHGKFGTVREAVKLNTVKQNSLTHTNSLLSSRQIPDGKKFAVKSITKKKLGKEISMLKRELEILRQVDHPNIIKVHEIYEDQMYLHIVMELCTGGDLFEYIIKQDYISEEEARVIMKKLLSAVNYLHNLNICHRDLKPENFLFSSQDEDAELKILDFGVSLYVQPGDQMKTVVGTLSYLAPEVLSGNYGRECDVWSLGVIMYQLLTGRNPFASESRDFTLKKVMKGEVNLNNEEWLYVSPQSKHLVSGMLQKNPILRIDAATALQHEWFHMECDSTQSNIVSRDVLLRIKKQQKESKLWVEGMKAILRYLSADKIRELKTTFVTLDTAGTGYITYAKLSEVMNKCGMEMGNEEIAKIFQKYGTEPGKINYTSFLIATLDRKYLLNEELMWDAYRDFDQENKGILHLDALKQALAKFGCEFSEQEFSALLAEIRFDPAKGFTFEDFKMIMQNFEEDNLAPRAEDGTPVRRLSHRASSVESFTSRMSIN